MQFVVNTKFKTTEYKQQILRIGQALRTEDVESVEAAVREYLSILTAIRSSNPDAPVVRPGVSWYLESSIPDKCIAVLAHNKRRIRCMAYIKRGGKAKAVPPGLQFTITKLRVTPGVPYDISTLYQPEQKIISSKRGFWVVLRGSVLVLSDGFPLKPQEREFAASLWKRFVEGMEIEPSAEFRTPYYGIEQFMYKDYPNISWRAETAKRQHERDKVRETENSAVSGNRHSRENGGANALQEAIRNYRPILFEKFPGPLTHMDIRSELHNFDAILHTRDAIPVSMPLRLENVIFFDNRVPPPEDPYSITLRELHNAPR